MAQLPPIDWRLAILKPDALAFVLYIRQTTVSVAFSCAVAVRALHDRLPHGEYRRADSGQTRCCAVRCKIIEKRCNQLARARTTRDYRMAGSTCVIHLAVAQRRCGRIGPVGRCDRIVLAG